MEPFSGAGRKRAALVWNVPGGNHSIFTYFRLKNKTKQNHKTENELPEQDRRQKVDSVWDYHTV